MLSPTLRFKGTLTALLLVTSSAASVKKSGAGAADFWRAMEPKKNTKRNLRDTQQQRLASLYKDLAAKAQQNGVTPRKLDQYEENEFGFDMASYSIKYTGCSSVETYSDEIADDREGSTVLETKRFAMFRLCPSDSCNKYSTNGCDSEYGEYLLELGEYLEAVTQFNEERMEDVCGYCAYCMQAVEDQAAADQDDNADADADYGDAEAQAYGDDGGYRERKLDEEAQEYDADANEYAEEAADEEEEDASACEHYDECQDYYDECVSWYQNQAMDIGNFMECVEVDYGDDDSGPQYYLAPHCGSDGSTITVGIYSDQYCSNYVGDQVSLQEITGMQFDATNSMSYFGKQCVSCVDAEEDEFWYGWDEEQDNNNNNNNQYGDYEEEQEVEVLEICRELYEQSAKCQDNLVFDNYGYGYAGYQSANQKANEQRVCTYMETLRAGTYNEKGEIVVGWNHPFNISQWNNKQAYIDEFSYVKQEASKVSTGRIVALVLFATGSLVLWVWACCLHAQLANKNMPWRPRRGKYSDPANLSRQSSGIVLGRSGSGGNGNSPLI